MKIYKLLMDSELLRLHSKMYLKATCLGTVELSKKFEMELHSIREELIFRGLNW